LSAAVDSRHHAAVTRSSRLQPRKIPRQSRSQATVDAIVEAATRILRSEGFERTNVNRVAELAGVSVGSLYQYFPTKEALIGAVATRLSQRMMAAFTADLGELAGLPLADAVRRIVERAFAAYRLDPRLRRILRHDVPEVTTVFDTPDFDTALREQVASHLDAFRARLRPRDLDLALRLLMTAVERIAETWGSADDVDADAVVAETADLVARYLLRDPTEG
jgi:AcrR family transcriptional regulator